MLNAVDVSLRNALSGLYVTPDVGFAGSEIYNSDLQDAVVAMHQEQITTASYAQFADLAHEMCSRRRYNPLFRKLAVCAAVCGSHMQIRRWYTSALQTAVSIHLNTIGAEDDCQFPRIVPHELADLRISDPAQISNRDVLWRILVTEPWIGFAERMRAQYRRMAEELSQPNGMAEVQELLKMGAPPKKKRVPKLTAEKRSIRRAYKLHERLFGSDNLRSLLRDKRLMLSGHLYRYHLYIDDGDLIRYTKKLDAGVGPMHILVTRKEDTDPADFLCSICVYFLDTPLIDHLIALSLHLIRESTELDLLNTAQVQVVSRAFYDDPILPELKGLRDPVEGPITMVENLALHANSDVRYQELRDNVDDSGCREFAKELMGYPIELLQALQYDRYLSTWSFIEDDEHAAPIMDRVKRCFR